MPEMPAFLANRLEPLFAKATRVTAVEEMAPKLRRVRFEGAALRGVPFVPGQQVEIRVGASAFRHYTPCSFDPARGSCDVLFFLHGRGPGSAWASGLCEGSPAGLLGPASPFTLSAGATTHVLMGDETCLGLFLALTRAAPPSARIAGAIEADPGSEGFPGLVGLALDSAVRSAQTESRRGAPLRDWLSSKPAWPRGTTFYLVGHAGTILDLRKDLEQRGVSRRAIRTQAYWATGKRGL